MVAWLRARAPGQLAGPSAPTGVPVTSGDFHTTSDPMATIHINGQVHRTDVPDETPLLWVLRDVLNMTGTKFGCGVAACGACTVRVDGQPVRACVTPVSTLAGKRIQTIEALGSPGKPHALQAAWIAEQVPQCGYCQSGQLMTAAKVISVVKKDLSRAEILEAMSGNICRCGTYNQIAAAVSH
eukprot:gene26085-47287_t